MNPLKALRLMLLWALVMAMILLTDATSMPASSQPLKAIAPQAEIPGQFVAHYLTAFEREARGTSALGYFVPRVVVISADSWTSPKEDWVVTEHDARRWKRAQTWRRSF